MHASFSGPTNDASNDIWFVYDAKWIVWIRQQNKLDTKTSLSKAIETKIEKNYDKRTELQAQLICQPSRTDLACM
jgi:hypothetical protein